MKRNRPFDTIYESNGIITLSRSLNRQVVIDTKPLLLYFFGSFDRRNGTNFVSKLGYRIEDFDYLDVFIRLMKIDRLIVTHQTLAEFCHFTRKNIEDEELMKFIEHYFNLMNNFCGETFIPIKFFENKKYEMGKFGITDVSLVLAMQVRNYNGIIVDDIALSGYCDKECGQKIIADFNSIRSYFQTIR